MAFTPRLSIRVGHMMGRRETLEDASSITWNTGTSATNQKANAIRWSTWYNFRFDADQPPQIASATVGFFKTGSPMTVEIQAPGHQKNINYRLAAQCSPGRLFPGSSWVARWKCFSARSVIPRSWRRRPIIQWKSGSLGVN